MVMMTVVVVVVLGLAIEERTLELYRLGFESWPHC